MSIINYASREIQFKIVYYGPALCGKTTNLSYIHQRINPANRGDLVSLATAADRTLFFDFLPLNAVVIKGFVTKFQLYTVPGQVIDRKSTRLNSSHANISYAVFCLKKKSYHSAL